MPVANNFKNFGVIELEKNLRTNLSIYFSLITHLPPLSQFSSNNPLSLISPLSLHLPIRPRGLIDPSQARIYKAQARLANVS